MYISGVLICVLVLLTSLFIIARSCVELFTEPYKFTQDWLKYDNFDKLERELLTSQPIHILELGTYEGRSALYMLDKFCKHKDSRITTADIIMSNNLKHNLGVRKSNKLSFIKGDFHELLRAYKPTISYMI